MTRILLGLDNDRINGIETCDDRNIINKNECKSKCPDVKDTNKWIEHFLVLFCQSTHNIYYLQISVVFVHLLIINSSLLLKSNSIDYNYILELKNVNLISLNSNFK